MVRVDRKLLKKTAYLYLSLYNEKRTYQQQYLKTRLRPNSEYAAQSAVTTTDRHTGFFYRLIIILLHYPILPFGCANQAATSPAPAHGADQQYRFRNVMVRINLLMSLHCCDGVATISF
jgi:hypothetical protein